MLLFLEVASIPLMLMNTIYQFQKKRKGFAVKLTFLKGERVFHCQDHNSLWL